MMATRLGWIEIPLGQWTARWTLGTGVPPDKQLEPERQTNTFLVRYM